MDTNIMNFSLGGQRFGLLVHQVENIIKAHSGLLLDTGFRATMPLWLAFKQIAVLDQPLPVVSLARKLGLEASVPRDGGRLLLTHSGGLRCALLVDEVYGLVHASNQQLRILPAWLNAGGSRTVWGCYLAPDDSLTILLDPDNIFTASESAAINHLLTRQLEGATR